MIEKIQFETEEEKQNIIAEKQSLVLIEVQTLFEGNFLIFSDTPPEKEVVYVNVPEEKFNQQENRITEVENVVNIILLGGI